MPARPLLLAPMLVACAERGPILPADALVLDGVRVRDALGPRDGVAIVIAGGEIWSIEAAHQAWPADARVLDLDGSFVVPGLVDAHVHLFHSGATTWPGDTLEANIRAQLAWGVTALADLGGPEAVFALRERIRDGSLVGPRIRASGPMLTAVGSHPCETVSDPELCRFVEGDGAEAVGELQEADLIKVALADAGFTPWPTPRLDLADLTEIVETARQPVWAHTDSLQDARDAEAAGVSVLAHPVFAEVLDPSTLPGLPTLSTMGAFSGTAALLSGELLAEDLEHVPPAVVRNWRALHDDPGLLVEGWAEESARWEAAARQNLALAIAEGRPVIAGSDAGYWFVPHGLGLHRELEALVEAGMSPRQALAAATLEPARLLGWDDLGLVSAGYRADLLVLPADPFEDVRALREIEILLLGGEAWTGQTGEAGAGICLDDADCEADARCDRVHHSCVPACPEPWALDNDCGPEAACLPADGLEGDGVCRARRTCDLYAQDCAPAAYGEACVPLDRDTSSCWSAGPASLGAACDLSDGTTGCAPGLYCSPIDGLCYALCDPGAPGACAIGVCEVQRVDGADWFGLCL